MIRGFPLIALCCVLVMSCSRHPVAGRGHASPSPEPRQNSAPAADKGRSYQLPVERAQTAVLAALGDLGYTVIALDEDQHTVQTDWVETKSRELSKGKGLLGEGEKRGANGVLNAMADLPETTGPSSRKQTTPGKQGETGVSTTVSFGDVGVWTKCRHRLTVSFAPASEGKCRVEARPEIQCWEVHKHGAWVTCTSRGRVESDFFTALEAAIR